ncbi:MAG TPA: Gfo/Idh/MocA family oxidoreductase [Silvibacterium sp.]|nr:Gfo/Idh/MocA family oxidoreductase [Silvibacterium sp.]
MTDTLLHVAVVGAGAFGRNHLRVYRDLQQRGYPVRLAAIVETEPSRAAALSEEWAAPVYTSVDACLDARIRGEIRLDAASVCVPTSAHHAVAAPMLAAGVDLLVEKPIAADTAQAADLLTIAQEHNRILAVGHLERFNPAVTAIQPWLNRPMFFEAHRLSVFTPRALDVDVVLDLMIHDLDIVISFVQSPVRDLHAVGLPILSAKVDIANVRIEFESGCVANFTASRVSTERVRKLRFFQPHQYISIDYARQDLLVIDVDPNASATPSFPGLPPGLAMRKPPVHPGEPLRLEIESFLDCIRTRAVPRVTGQEGLASLALALDINTAIATHARRTGLDRF